MPMVLVVTTMVIVSIAVVPELMFDRYLHMIDNGHLDDGYQQLSGQPLVEKMSPDVVDDTSGRKKVKGLKSSNDEDENFIRFG